MLQRWQLLIGMQCKGCTNKWLTRPKIKKNTCRWTKNCHYTWDCIWVSLSFIGSNSKDTSLCSRLRSMSILRSKTTSCLRFGRDNGSYSCLTKTLNKGSMLIGLPNWTEITQKWVKSLDVSSLPAMITYLRHNTNAKMKMSTIQAPLCPRSLYALKVELRWSTMLGWRRGSKRLEELIELKIDLEEFLEKFELLLFFDGYLEMKLNPSLLENY